MHRDDLATAVEHFRAGPLREACLLLVHPDPAQLHHATRHLNERFSWPNWPVGDGLSAALGGRPQTYQEIQPAFLRALHQAAHEALPELRDLLRDSFLPDDAGRWHAPDPNKAEDLERLRRRALLAEFETYLGGKGRLKQFRVEAVRAGFADAWRRKAFDDIHRVAARLPERVIQEDPDLLLYYDAASLRG